MKSRRRTFSRIPILPRRRKADPGELFPWVKLAAAGIGHYLPPYPLGSDMGLSLGDEGAEVWDLSVSWGPTVTGLMSRCL